MDGKIIACGIDGGTCTTVSRYNSDGSLDPSFGSWGIGHYETIVKVPMQQDGRLIGQQGRILAASPSVVSPAVSLRDIVEFKRRRADDLLRFQQELRKVQTFLRDSGNLATFHDSISHFELSLQVSLNDLTSAFKDSSIALKWGNIKAIVLLSAAGAFAALPTAIGLFGAAALKLTDVAIKSSAERNASLRNSPIFYLFHARSANILLA